MSVDPRLEFLRNLQGESALADAQLYSRAYPTKTISSASEIFNIWICRMIMLGYHFTGQTPFEDVFIHAVVRDEKGRKFSKSLGNGIEPEDLLDKYSADSIRMALLSQVVPGRDIMLSPKSAGELAVKWRNFGNKLWNIARFLFDREDTDKNPDSPILKPESISAASGWIWEKLDFLQQQITKNMQQYRLGQVMDDIYRFVWDDLADWYIEYLKTDPDEVYFAQNSIFIPLLKLIHPFIPFESEVIWQQIHKDTKNTPDQAVISQQQISFDQENLLLNQTFVLPKIDRQIFDVSEFELVKGFAVYFRQLRGLYRLDPSVKTAIFSDHLLLHKYAAFLQLIARVQISHKQKQPEETKMYGASFEGIDFVFDLAGLIGDIGAESSRSQKDLQEIQKEIFRLESLLLNTGFMSRAGSEKIQETRVQLEGGISKAKAIKEKIDWLESVS